MDSAGGPSLEELIESRFFPLDPLYKVHCKLFIAQIWKLPLLSKTFAVFSLNGHPIMRAEICGTVVRRDEKDGRLMFVVDDGSGLLEVLLWEKRFEREAPIDWAQIRLGTLVRVRGRLSVYLEHPQMTAFAVDLLDQGLDGVLQEMEQWTQCQRLARQYYEQSATAHLTPERTLLRAIVLGEEIESDIASEGKRIKGHNHHVNDDDRNDVFDEMRVLRVMGEAFVSLSSGEEGTMTEQSLAQHLQCDIRLMRQALTRLCDNGGAFWTIDSSDGPKVTQIRPEKNLAQAIVRVVGSNQMTAGEIATTLKEDPRWACVRSDQIDVSLEYLAEESVLFNMGDDVWKKV